MADDSTITFELLGDLKNKQFQIIAGVLENELNSVPRLTLEFTCRDKKLDLNSLVGVEMGLVISDSVDPAKKQPIWGTCTSAEFKGVINQDAHFFLEISPLAVVPEPYQQQPYLSADEHNRDHPRSIGAVQFQREPQGQTFRRGSATRLLRAISRNRFGFHKAVGGRSWSLFLL